MDSTDLTIAQAQAMRDRLTPYLRYLYGVQKRMDARGFPLTDELLRATQAAYDTAHALTMCLHYLSCKSGVGRTRNEPVAIPPWATFCMSSTTDGEDRGSGHSL